jgi:hypothetical protein
MNLKTEVNIKEFARNLAQGDDNQQAEFFNEFANELKVCCKDENLDGLQPCNISNKLNENGKDLIKSLMEFIRLRENNSK